MERTKDILQNRNGEMYIWAAVLILVICMIFSVILYYGAAVAVAKEQRKIAIQKLDAYTQQYSIEIYESLRNEQDYGENKHDAQHYIDSLCVAQGLTETVSGTYVAYTDDGAEKYRVRDIQMSVIVADTSKVQVSYILTVPLYIVGVTNWVDIPVTISSGLTPKFGEGENPTGGNSGNDPSNFIFAVTWKNWNGDILHTNPVVFLGSIPTYDGPTPTHSATDSAHYIFLDSWSPEVGPIFADSTFTAVFSMEPHSWGIPVYAWYSDCSHCMAIVCCTVCGYELRETATIQTNTTPATCTTAETYTHTARFTKAPFENQSCGKTDTGASALGHLYGTASYLWDGSHATCTANAVCQRTGCGYTVEETAGAVVVSQAAATCTAKEQIRHKVTFTNNVFSEQTCATAHERGELAPHSYLAENAQYVWASGHKSCSATVYCTNCHAAPVTETVSAAKVNHTAANCTDAERWDYQAVFSKSPFEIQTCSDGHTGIGKLGHRFPSVSYSWVKDRDEVCDACTATGTCSRCNLTLTEEARTVEQYNYISASCTDDERWEHIAIFDSFPDRVCDDYHYGESAYGHDWIDPTCTEAGYCRRCDAAGDAALDHDWSDWVTTEPTCTDEGVESRYCRRCNAEETNRIDALGHDFTAWDLVRAATCTADGLRARYCYECDYADSEVLPATGHSMSAYVQTAAPTCTTSGTKTSTCQNGCGTIYTVDVAALGHSWGAPVSYPADCINYSRTVKTCSRCNTEDITKTGTPPLGHDWTWVIVTESSCTATGLKTATCSQCDATNTADIPKTEHRWIYEYTDDKGLHHNYCYYCHESKTSTDYIHQQ